MVPSWDHGQALWTHDHEGADQGMHNIEWVVGKSKPTYNIYYLLLSVNSKIISANTKEMVMSKLPTMVAGKV